MLHSDRHVPAYVSPCWLVFDSDCHPVMKTQKLISKTRVSVAKCDQTAAPAWIQSINLASR